MRTGGWVVYNEVGLKVSRFLLVTRRQQDHSSRFDPVSNHVSTVSEVNNPLPEFVRHILDGTSDTWLTAENGYSLAYRLDSSLRSIDVVGGKETIEALHIQQRLL